MNEKEFLARAVQVAKDLQDGHLSVSQFHDLLKQLNCQYDLTAMFEDHFQALSANHGCLELYKERIKGERKKSIKLQLFSMDKNETHPPHGHVDMASFHIILRGSIYLRDYKMRERLQDGRIVFDKTFEGISARGDCSYISASDIHWFTAMENGTIILNFNVAGLGAAHGYQALDPEARDESRFYIDPTLSVNGASFCSPEISRAEASKRFSSGIL